MTKFQGEDKQKIDAHFTQKLSIQNFVKGIIELLSIQVANAR